MENDLRLGGPGDVTWLAVWNSQSGHGHSTTFVPFRYVCVPGACLEVEGEVVSGVELNPLTNWEAELC